MSRTSLELLSLVTCLSALPLMVGLTGCVKDRNNPGKLQRIGDNYAAERGSSQNTDQYIEDSRTAERVREALAAVADYRYHGVKVFARDGVVKLSGFVQTSAQMNSAGDVASKVVGVKSVENNLTVKD